MGKKKKTAYFCSKEQQGFLSINLHNGKFMLHNQLEHSRDDGRIMVSVQGPRFMFYLQKSLCSSFLLRSPTMAATDPEHSDTSLNIQVNCKDFIFSSCFGYLSLVSYAILTIIGFNKRENRKNIRDFLVHIINCKTIYSLCKIHDLLGSTTHNIIFTFTCSVTLNKF